MTTRRVFSATGDVAVQLLRLTVASADAFPPLKSAAGGALHIAEIVKKFRLNKNEWRGFGEYVRDATASVVQSLAQVDASRRDSRSKLEKLNVTLEETSKTIESELALPNRKRALKFMKDPEMIVDLRRRVDGEINLFQLSATMATMIDVGKIFDAVIANGMTLSSIAQGASALVVTAAAIKRNISQQDLKDELGKLRRVQDASWDSSRMCMENTRVKIVDGIMTWINSPINSNQSGGAEIKLLTAVAGGGKTTIAHTVAGRCAGNMILGSSFFFDRETAGRNTPAALFTTIAADISRLDDHLASCMVTAIENDPTLPSAPIFRQFEELVLKPCQECPIAGPVVIVIDALDEAWNKDLLDILRDHAHRLPSTFRIFVTSRMRPELDSLLRQPHASRVELNIHEQSSLDDLALYAPHKLLQLADRLNLAEDWPGEKLRAEFIAKAGGLFLWVTIVCGYLYNRDDPEAELEQLLSTTKLVGNSAEDQMNKLYARILESFDWTDPSFVAGYRRVMGTALVTKTPITISAMKELYHRQLLATDRTLQKLSPLLTGVGKVEHGSEPVRPLHQSLREFLVAQTPSSSRPVQSEIVEKEQSQQIASLSLQLLNRDLSRSIPGTGYLEKDEDEVPGVPVIGQGAISEALWYACQFWQDHVLDIESLAEIGELLWKFMDEKVILWIEVVAACGRCRGLSKVWRLLEAKENEATEAVNKYRKEYAVASLSLSNRLWYEGRREEAHRMADEAAQLFRQLAIDAPAASTSDLAKSLNNLSICFSDLGRSEEALAAIQEAAQLYRQLVADQPASFTPDLAMSLNNLSIHLSGLGRHEEALTVIQEAVQLRRELAADRPAEFTPTLAKSLSNLSLRLSDMGRRVEALTAIQEAAQLYRRLSVDRPSA
ncbi:POC1 centriolar protein A, partial [Ceratobasidium sp. 394]